METFDIAVDGFSGPLDLLCALVEKRELEASKIKVAQLVRIYGIYLARTRKASADTLAEFFYLVARLLLEKTRALLPGAAAAEPELDDEEFVEMDEDSFMETLARYRPYRAAYRWLAGEMERAGRSFRRLPDGPGGDGDEEKSAPAPENLEYDVGDLYYLARVWWGAYERYNRATRLRRQQLEEEEAADWDGFGEPVPDEEQIQTRIAELEEQLTAEGVLFLSALCRLEGQDARSVKALVVTLLALLEMCRMGKISIEQEVLFADVKVLAKSA